MLIITDSIARNIVPRRIFPKKTTQIIRLSGNKDILEATSAIENTRFTAPVVQFIVGTNDLNKQKSLEETIQKLENLIQSTRKALPSAKIVLSSVLPRVGHGVFNAKRDRYNTRLNDSIKKKLDIQILNLGQPNLSLYDRDGLHLKPTGLAWYIRYMKVILNPMLNLGVYNWQPDTLSERRQSPYSGNLYTKSGSNQHQTIPQKITTICSGIGRQDKPKNTDNYYQSHPLSNQTGNSYHWPRLQQSEHSSSYSQLGERKLGENLSSYQAYPASCNSWSQSGLSGVHTPNSYSSQGKEMSGWSHTDTNLGNTAWSDVQPHIAYNRWQPGSRYNTNRYPKSQGTPLYTPLQNSSDSYQGNQQNIQWSNQERGIDHYMQPSRAKWWQDFMSPK